VSTIATLDEQGLESGPSDRGEPGLVLVFAGREPLLRAILSGVRGSVTVGRHDVGGARVPDERMSQRHARIAWDGEHLAVEDLASRNGTFIDGVRIEGPVERASARVIRAGRTLLVPVRDVRRFLGAKVTVDAGIVVGPTLSRALADIGAAAARGDIALLRGETGAGKENAARVFHAKGANAAGPFVPVNCATVPATVAERLLFGAKRGAYSGAAEDADGFCAAADRGTLFLDEIGELPLEVQAKLLRFLETKEFFPLGASKPRRVSVRVCCATHRDLRDGIASQTFRADLYYRLSTFEVTLPPLRERMEEIPWLVRHAVAAAGLATEVHASFVEACLLRPWPGNVRELLGAVHQALHAAGAEPLSANHLPPNAGIEPGPPPRPPSLDLEPGSSSKIRVAGSAEPALGEREAFRARALEALRRTGGNQTSAAALVGVSRRTFIRRLEELDIPRPRAMPKE
jgi:DNA-binding NtrC family response regulator